MKATTLKLTNLVTSNLEMSQSESCTYVGIDFGTSTTIVSFSYYDSENHTIICKTMELEQILQDGAVYDESRVPSVIAVYRNKILVGQGAADLKYALEKDREVWYSFKMELGENLGPKYCESILGKNASFQILNAKDATIKFFRFLKNRIESYIEKYGLNKNIKYAVSIPASFEANQRQDLVDALECNQMDVNRQSLIDEPNAAFLSYIQESEEKGEPIVIPDNINPKILVFDFGAGTCDISILEIGANYEGVYTKNLSISKFEELGGDNIDRYITYEILLPELFKHNPNVDYEMFMSSEKKKIANRLISFAENLKIRTSEAIRLMGVGYDPSTVRSIKEHIEIETTKGTLSLDGEISMTFAQFEEVMKVFTRKKKGDYKPKGHTGNSYNSIYNPVITSLKKAGLSESDIDYILFVGGSSKNPYIQKVMKSWFPDAKPLYPSDTQQLVSKGAAIHSFIYNGFGQNIVQAITSEPICIITQNDELMTLIPAGTAIPTNTIEINNLVTAREGQKKVELPICISSRNKILTNIVVTTDNPDGFPINTSIELVLSLTPDKLLDITAKVGCELYMINSINPYANKELTTQEREVLKIEKQSYEDAANNCGVPSKSMLLELAKAYEKADLYLKAAETYERCNDLYSGAVSFNRLSNCYACAGNEKKDLYYGEMAYKTNKNSTTAFNLAYAYKNIDVEKYLKYLHESLVLSPNKPHSLFELGKYEKKQGLDSGEEKIRKAFNIWKEQYDNGTLNEVDYTWLPDVARELGMYSLATEVRKKAQTLKDKNYYDSNDTAKRKE